jgi:predicted flap endonuclease-1-like 5' DNA nuclease
MNLVNLWWLCLGALIGWLVQWIWDWMWFRARRRVVSVEVDSQVSTLQAERDKLAVDLKACGDRRLALEGEVNTLKGQLGDLEKLRIRVGELEPLVGRVDTLNAENAKLREELALALAAGAAGTVLGAAVGNEHGASKIGVYDEDTMVSLREYNLTMYDELGATRRALVRFSGGLGDPLIDIDGIGPVYQKKLYDQGVITFEQVAAMHPDRLRTLVAPNAVFELNTLPWIEQARRMAGTPYRDPLIDIYGVGPVYEQRLLNAGITTFEQLGNMTPDEIVTVIKPASYQLIDPEAWIKEARELAAQVRAGTYRKGEY